MLFHISGRPTSFRLKALNNQHAAGRTNLLPNFSVRPSASLQLARWVLIFLDLANIYTTSSAVIFVLFLWKKRQGIAAEICVVG